MQKFLLRGREKKKLKNHFAPNDLYRLPFYILWRQLNFNGIGVNNILKKQAYSELQ